MERRVYPRVQISHTVLYHLEFYPKPIIASTLDLSLGGTKIESLYSLSAEEGLGISITIQPQIIRSEGKVVHVLERDDGKFEAGIQFREMSQYDREYLRQHLFQVMEQQAVASLSSDGTPHRDEA